MEGFGLLCGHLVGDYVFQNDYQAKRKTSSTPVCLLHCVLYTLAVWLFSLWWMPAWGLAVVFAAHFVVDRWRLAGKWMGCAGQREFASGVFAPWSVIVVDNTFHLVTLFAVAVAA